MDAHADFQLSQVITLLTDELQAYETKEFCHEKKSEMTKR